jgi:prepilin-type N-terminal cleavage/methylation domain-containing protein
VRRGFTLIELVAVLAVLAITLGVSVVAWRTGDSISGSRVASGLDSARTSAIVMGRSTTWRDGGQVVRFWPDGSSSGGTVTVDGWTATVDPLTGAIRAP